MTTHVPELSMAERDRRWGLARTFMEREDLDALVVFGEHEDSGAAPYNIDNWFTNDRPGVTVVFKKTHEPVILTPMPSFIFEHLECSARGDDLWIAPESVRLGRGSEALLSVLKDQGLMQSTIGILGLEPGGPWHPEGVIPFKLWDKIVSQVPEATFKPVGNDFVTSLVMKHSEEEIALLRHAANIGNSMVNAMVMATSPGVTENEVVKAAIGAALALGTAVPLMHLNSGPQAVIWGPPRWGYRAQAPRVLQSGDVVTSEVFCNFGSRAIQLQCTIAIGNVHEDIERAALVARASYEEGLKALRPGAKFADVADAMLKPVQDAGGWTKGPQVHSLNPISAVCGFKIDLSHLGLPSQRYSSVANVDHARGDMVVEKGMSFALEPSCGIGPYVVTLGGSVYVDADGSVELNPMAAHLLRANQ